MKNKEYRFTQDAEVCFTIYAPDPGTAFHLAKKAVAEFRVCEWRASVDEDLDVQVYFEDTHLSFEDVEEEN